MAISRRYVALVVLFCGCSLDISSTQQVDPISSSCAERTVCRECIQLPGCFWCSQPDLVGARCMDQESTDANDCPSDHRQDPHSNTIAPTMVHTEQVSPSAVQMELRVGEPQTFTVQVTPSSDYPLDLYILMDLSQSMQMDLNRVRALIDELTTRLGEITSDFRLGFGAFNEKPIVPFVVPGQTLRILDRTISSTDYSYRHIVSLTDNITLFRNSINAVNTTYNEDGPEALLEALVQVAVCKDVIGWRVAARKLIIVMTDNGFHTAGDGRMLGLIKRSDGNCYVPRQGPSGLPVDYQAWNVFDYPSLGQVQQKLRENDIVLIIAATQQFQPLYQTVVEEQLTGAYFRVLEQAINSNEGNFLDIIESSYNTSSQTVELVPSPAQGVLFSITASCSDARSLGSNTCGEVGIDQTVSFEVQVMLTRCLSDDPSSVIHIPGFGTIDVQISPLCNCSCEAETDINSTECRGGGHLSCGVCDCFTGRFGSQCQCTDEASVSKPCPVWGLQNLECNGRGVCECGICICNQPRSSVIDSLNVTRPMYFGDACECDNFNCPTSNEYVCSGRGECLCGTCRCDSSTSDGLGSPYRGVGCECPPEDQVCLNPANNLTCSDHGRCLCSECFCDEDYGGEFCNISTVILPTSCDGQTCVECVKGLSSSPEECRSLNCSETVVLIDEVDNQEYTIDGLETLQCSFVDSSGCQHFYFVADGRQIEAEKTQVCGGVSLAIPIWSIATIIVGGLLLVGLLVLIIIKIILLWLERREYNRWKKELEEADFGVRGNPLYTSCKQDYRNVAYEDASTSVKVQGKYKQLSSDSEPVHNSGNDEEKIKDTIENNAYVSVEVRTEQSNRDQDVAKETCGNFKMTDMATDLFQITTEM